MSWLILGQSRVLVYHSLTGVLGYRQTHHESILIRKKKEKKEKNKRNLSATALIPAPR